MELVTEVPAAAMTRVVGLGAQGIYARPDWATRLSMVGGPS